MNTSTCRPAGSKTYRTLVSRRRYCQHHSRRRSQHIQACWMASTCHFSEMEASMCPMHSREISSLAKGPAACSADPTALVPLTSPLHSVFGARRQDAPAGVLRCAQLHRVGLVQLHRHRGGTGAQARGLRRKSAERFTRRTGDDTPDTMVTYGCGSKICAQNGTLVNGTKD